MSLPANMSILAVLHFAILVLAILDCFSLQAKETTRSVLNDSAMSKQLLVRCIHSSIRSSRIKFKKNQDNGTCSQRGRTVTTYHIIVIWKVKLVPREVED